jgi:hypothetical protein
MVLAAGLSQWQPAAPANGVVAVDQAIAETDDAWRLRKLHKRLRVCLTQPDKGFA